MPAKPKRTARLGRGLSSLMAQPVAVQTPATPPADVDVTTSKQKSYTPEPSAPPPAAAAPAVAGLVHLPLDAIVPNPHQPRKHMDESSLRSLAESIRRDGLMQPIVVRPTPGPPPAQSAAPGTALGAPPAPATTNEHRSAAPENPGLALAPAPGSPGPASPTTSIPPGSYELVAGERRWRAARLAGLDAVPAWVRDITDEQSAEWALIENLQREDLNPIERAEAFDRLRDHFGLSHDQIADRVGLDRSTITNLLRLLGLSQEVRTLVADGVLSMGQARAITGLTDPAAQLAVAQRAVRQGQSVRQVEAAVRVLLGDATTPSGAPGKRIRSAYLADLEKQIADQLQTRVSIKAGRKKGSGALTIEFYSLDQFDTLLGKLGVQTE